MATRQARRLLAAPKLPARLYHFERSEHCPPTPTLRQSLRHFTTTHPTHARAGHKSSGREVSPVKAGAKAQPSLALMQKKAQREALTSGKMFDEFGILPDTFVLQRASERPSWTSAFGDRAQWEKARLKDRLLKAYQFLAIKLFMVRLQHPADYAALPLAARLKSYLPAGGGYFDFEVRRVARIAEALYTEVYTALAAGDIDGVAAKVKKDMYGGLKSRVLARASGTETRWSMRGAKSRTVAYTVALVDPKLPKWRQTFLQQAVVEIEGEQRLVRKGGKWGEKVEEKKVREYVVIHRQTIEGVSEGWKVWGMTRPTTLADVKKEERKRLGLGDEESLS